MSKSKVFVAGVGLSQQSSGGGAATLVSAATKALLDAGVTYDNVVKGVRSKQLRDGDKAFDSFGDDGVPVEQVAKGSELKSAFELVQKGKAACVLAIVADEVRCILAYLGPILTGTSTESCSWRGSSFGRFHAQMAISERLLRPSDWLRWRQQGIGI